MSIAAWQTSDSVIKIMAGNLEEGINHSSDKSVHTSLYLPDQKIGKDVVEINEIWNGVKTITWNKKVNIDLGQGETKLFSFSKK